MTDNKTFTDYLATTSYHQGCAAAAVARFAEDGNAGHLDEALELLSGDVEKVDSMDALGDLSYRAATTISLIVNSERDTAREALEKFIAAAGSSKPKPTKRTAAKAKPKAETKPEPVEDKPAPKPTVEPEPQPDPVETKPEPQVEVKPESAPQPKSEPKSAPAISESFGAAPISSQGF